MVGVAADNAGDDAVRRGEAMVIVGAGRILKSDIVGGVESVSEVIDGGAGCGIEASAIRSSAISGFSKSQGTPCLTQLPHRG